MNTDTLTTTDDRHPLMERVELINHLLKFSDRLFTIMSTEADELNTFARLLMEDGQVGLKFAHVTPQLALTAEDVAADLAKAWGVEVGFGESASQAIEQHLPELITEPRRAAAIINDVERLPRSALNDLITFMQHMDGLTQGRVRLVLMGSPSLASQLQGLKSMSDGAQVYALHLSGGSTPAPHAAALEGQEDMHGQATHSTEKNHPSRDDGEHTGLPGRTLLIAGLGISLVLAISMALLMRPGEPEPAKEQQVSIALSTEKTEPKPVEPPPTVQATAPVTSEPAPVVESAPVPAHINASADTQPSAEPPPPTTPEAKEKPSEGTSPAPLKAEEAHASKPLTAPEALPVDATTKTAQVAAPAKESAKPAKSPDTKASGNWFAEQNKNHYVLQIITLKSAKDLDQFVRTNGLKDCHSFVQKRDGKVLHTLTCGIYTSRDDAVKAVANLPEKARASSPYPRRVDDVRKVMQP